MKKGDTILCRKSYKKDGIYLLTKGKNYIIYSDVYGYEPPLFRPPRYRYKEAILIKKSIIEACNDKFITSTTNNDCEIIEFIIHKPSSFLKRIQNKIYKNKIYKYIKIPIHINTKYFSDYFYTDKDIRRLKLKKINKN